MTRRTSKVQRRTAGIAPTALRADVRGHRGFDALVRQKLFLVRDQLLSRLGGALRPQKRYRVGPLPFSDRDAVIDWLNAFRDAPAEVMPVRDLLARVHEVDPDLCRSHFIPNLTDSVAPDRLERALAFLRDRHASPAAGHLSGLLRVHNSYLRVAAADAGFPALLPRLRLLSRAGAWADPAGLCAGVTGVDPAQALDEEQEEVLRHRIKIQQPREIKSAPGKPLTPVSNVLPLLHEAARQLDEYFATWAATSEEAGGWVGAFLSLLGDFEPVRKVAKKYLPHGRAPEYVRAAVGLRERIRVVGGGQVTEAPSRIMALQRFLVEVTEPRPTGSGGQLAREGVRRPGSAPDE
jgi:hypothetical protein